MFKTGDVPIKQTLIRCPKCGELVTCDNREVLCASCQKEGSLDIGKTEHTDGSTLARN